MEDESMNKYIKRSMWFAVALLGLQVMGSAELIAGEPESKNAALSIDNVGFMENPPKELKEKFPMCDVFLKVEWIDKDKNIGYSQYDFYKDGKKTGRVTSALVHLDEQYPAFDYNLERYRKNRKLKEIFALIKRGEVERGMGEGGSETLMIADERKAGRFVQEFDSIEADWDIHGLSLAEHKMNVCIPYPDNQRMFFAEKKKVGKVYDESEIASKQAELKKWISNLPFFKEYTLMDVNFDGKEDYYAEGILYSYGDRYYEMKIKEPGLKGGPNTQLIVPTTEKTCEFLALSRGDYYFTTDGKSIFINNQCNLTELTK
jgi:hypothetical protein